MSRTKLRQYPCKCGRKRASRYLCWFCTGLGPQPRKTILQVVHWLAQAELGILGMQPCCTSLYLVFLTHMFCLLDTCRKVDSPQNLTEYTRNVCNLASSHTHPHTLLVKKPPTSVQLVLQSPRGPLVGCLKNLQHNAAPQKASMPPGQPLEAQAVALALVAQGARSPLRKL